MLTVGQHLADLLSDRPTDALNDAIRECNLVLARSRFYEISAFFSEIDLGLKIGEISRV